MFGAVDAGDDGFEFVIRRGRIVVAVLVDGFAGVVVDEADAGRRSFFWFGFGFGRGSRLLGLVVGFEVVFEHAVFALKGATGGGEIAQDEVVFFDFLFRPGGDGRGDVGDVEGVKFPLNAEAEPFGLGGFEDEGVEQGVFGGVVVGFEPGVEEGEPVGLVFVVGDEGFGAHAVDHGIAGGGGAAFGSGCAGSAGVAFFVFFLMSVFWMIWGGFGRIGDVFRWLGGFGNFVFERHLFTTT